jgi:predicted ribosome quality control (RQC) complex YloA/Tae2 family protein
MLKVPVVTAWLVNAFENSSEYSEYYLDLQSGKLCYYAPMDFPEHDEKVKKMDNQPESFMRLPKLEKSLDLKIKQNFIDNVANPVLKEILSRALAADVDFRKALMEDDYEEVRREWYKFQNDRYAAYLKEWFKAKGIELVEAEAPGKTDPSSINK